MNSVPFVPFNCLKTKVEKSKSRLPHWSREGATHFVTFRLADAIPAEAKKQWRQKREEWLARCGTSSDEQNWFGRLTAEQRREYRSKFGATFEKMMDRGQGECLLRKEANAGILAECLHHFDGEKYFLGDYVIMPNHVHVLVIPLGENILHQIVGAWKGFSSRQMNQKEGRSGALWQRESFDHAVRTERQLQRFVDYIADNPLKAGLSPESCRRYQVEWKR
ncbi:MAG: transposase [Roseibacillus sp.]